MQLSLESRMIISVYFKKIVVIMLAPFKRCGVSVESFELLFRKLDFFRFAATESCRGLPIDCRMNFCSTFPRNKNIAIFQAFLTSLSM